MSGASARTSLGPRGRAHLARARWKTARALRARNLQDSVVIEAGIAACRTSPCCPILLPRFDPAVSSATPAASVPLTEKKAGLTLRAASLNGRVPRSLPASFQNGHQRRTSPRSARFPHWLAHTGDSRCNPKAAQARKRGEKRLDRNARAPSPRNSRRTATRARRVTRRTAGEQRRGRKLWGNSALCASARSGAWRRPAQRRRRAWMPGWLDDERSSCCFH